VHETAEALYIHRNTLHKRLRRIEELLDVRLDVMDDIVEIFVALRASDLTRTPLSKGVSPR